MARIYKITEGSMHSTEMKDTDSLIEQAFNEGCEHGYKKAMKEMEAYNEKSGKSMMQMREGFEEKIERLKEKYK
jgi:flagellar biosynthesis/type III secretory pathway protein FliH